AVGLWPIRLRRKRSMRPAHPLVPEKPFENSSDVVWAAEHPVEAGAAPAQPDQREIADGGVTGALAIDDYRRSALEEGLADEELAAPGELDDQAFVLHWLGRRDLPEEH